MYWHLQIIVTFCLGQMITLILLTFFTDDDLILAAVVFTSFMESKYQVSKNHLI